MAGLLNLQPFIAPDEQEFCHPVLVKYLDTSRDDASDTLGSWILGALGASSPVTELRLQTGYFGAASLGLLERTFSDLSAIDATTRILIGSNEAQTSAADLQVLLDVVGNPRPGLQLGVVALAGSLFHPKVYHFTRQDQSATAYIGSANFTAPAATGRNVEAGIALDSKQGDSRAVLDEISSVIDAWFVGEHSGVMRISTQRDIDELLSRGLIRAVPAAPRSRHAGREPRGSRRTALFSLPRLKSKTIFVGVAEQEAAAIPPPSSAATLEWWRKTLSSGDAQRKNAGNQSGAIALTQGGRRGQIDQTTFFRNTLFGEAEWSTETTRTGGVKEVASVPMRVHLDGVDLGELRFRVSHAPNRESGQHNYTTQLHLGPLAQHFSSLDMTGRQVSLEKLADGSFALEIS